MEDPSIILWHEANQREDEYREGGSTVLPFRLLHTP